MENASKALIMAGGILIGVIIMSIGVYLFASFGGTSKKIQDQMDDKVLAEFNNNFLKYDKSTTCTMHDIVTLVNFAKKNNIENDNDLYHIEVYVKGVGYNGKDLSEQEQSVYTNLLINYSINPTTNDTQHYTCTNITIEELERPGSEEKMGRVGAIYFEKNNQ